MKVPDKIYVREYPDGIARFWEEKKKDDVVATIPHEYIRKDYLLEWAKAEIELSKKIECASEKSYEEGRRQVAQNLIDKLNEI